MMVTLLFHFATNNEKSIPSISLFRYKYKTCSHTILWIDIKKKKNLYITKRVDEKIEGYTDERKQGHRLHLYDRFSVLYTNYTTFI